MKNNDYGDNPELIRFGLPSKGRMETEALEFLAECGFRLRRNRRQYIAKLDGFRQIQIVFQRQRDIIRGIQSGNLTFGIVGLDLSTELSFRSPDKILVIHNALGFGKCTLEVAIPEEWTQESMKDLKNCDRVLRVASKFPNLTKQFFQRNNLKYELIEAVGTIEVAPALDYADIVVDLVSTGQTLEDNRLKRLRDGCILSSQAAFIGNREALKNPEILNIARIFLEYFEATIRAGNFVSVFVNMRGKSPKEIAKNMFSQKELAGLQGPTISPVISQYGGEWHAVHIVVDKTKLTEAIAALRSIGGSGVVVSPTLFIFEEEPEQYKKLLQTLEARE
ncbi:MAG: ATP phosphoribosyltransferase [Candidatus Hodarchaeota archaeon]